MARALRRQLPEFISQRELVRFLDDPRVDLSAYDLEAFGEQADVDVDDAALRLQEEAEYGRAEPLRPVTMRLDNPLIRALKRIGARRGVSYQTLARMWLRERAIEELRAGTVRGPRKPSALY
jgi:predicted DNA binding CopG/RHH family protein